MRNLVLIFLYTLPALLLAPLSFAQQPQTYEQTIKSANERFNEKDFMSAKTYYELALRLKPGDALATKRLSETISLIQKQMDEQQRFYSFLDEGDKQLALGNDEAALSAYRKALQVFPNDRYVLAQVEKINLKREEAKQKQNNYNIAMERGTQFLNTGRYEEAILQFGLALGVFPDNADATTKMQQAEQALLQIRQKELEFQQLMAEARNQLTRRNYSEASTIVAKALTLFPHNSDALGLQAEASRLSALSARYESALARADKAYENRQLTEARSLYAEAQKIWPEQGLPADMIRRIDEVLGSESYRNEVLVASLLKEADEAYIKKDTRLALEKYNKILEINPEHPLAGSRSAELTFAMRQQQRQLEEQALYDRLISEGAAHENKKDYTAAIAAYTKALETRPGDSRAKERLDAVKVLLAERDKISAAAERYAALMSQGRDLLKKNEFAAALERFSEALTLKPGDPDAEFEKNRAEQHKREAETKSAVETKYAQLIQAADNAFAALDFKTAELVYTEAAGLKPTEEYPRMRAKISQDNLARAQAEAAATQRYKLLVEEADTFFAQQNFDRASELYHQAVAVRPMENYPQNQLARIAEARQNLARKQETEQRVNSLLAQANDLMLNSRWSEAISIFVQVLNLDPFNTTAAARKAEAELAIERNKKENQQRFEQSLAEADRQMGLNNYQDAIAAYKIALGLKPGDDYAMRRISQAEALILERLNNLRNQYNRIIAEADRNFNARNYDRAIELYLDAENTKPDENYPRQMITRIADLFEQNKVREVMTSSFVLESNTSRRLTFEPLDVADRRSSYVIIKARNVGKGNFPLLVQFGSNNARNGGFVLPIPDNEAVNDFVVHIGAQYRWFSEDNNWLELIPENGSVEIRLVRISKQ